jgi:hypothetical protein
MTSGGIPKRAIDPTAAAAAYADLRSRAEADPNVVGLVLAGSRGFDDYVTAASDFDVYVVLGAGLPTEWRTPHGSPAETWPMTLETFRDHALSGPEDAWNRPTFLGAQVVLDKLDGEIGRIVDRKRVLTADEAEVIAAASLGDYINSLYRSLRNLEAGRDLEGRLDALESLSPLLATVFAFESRVRPFNKWLRHELAARPLGIDGLIALVDRIATDPTPTTQRDAFRLIEAAAREHGHGGVVDSWEPDVDWLRGPASW